MRKTNRFLGGRYRLLRLLGEGGMGQVYQAVDEASGRRVAIKLIRKESSGARDIERFRREASIIKAIGHENICEVLDVSAPDAAEHYYVMPFMKGVTLSDRLKKARPLSPESVFDIAFQILDGLGAVHEKRIIHRDLKASNIFLILGTPKRHYFVKILDFGISKMMDQKKSPLTDTGTVIGTIQYMAPEQATGAKEIDQRVDIYATGLILYEMLTGNNPFRDLSTDERSPYAARPIKPPRSVAPGISRAVEDVVMTALAHDPVDRFENVKAMGVALHNAGKRAESRSTSSAPPCRGTDLRIPRPKSTVQ